jgi:hypothetical protein
VRLDRARDHHQAAGLLIQPVHDAGTRDLGELGVEMQQCVLQGPGGVARAWMHDQSGWLVDHQHMWVLEDDVQPDFLGRDLDRVRQRGADLDALPAQDLVLGPQFGAVDQHLAGVDPLLDAGPRKAVQQLRQNLVEALAGVFGGNGQLAMNDFGHLIGLLVRGNFAAKWPPYGRGSGEQATPIRAQLMTPTPGQLYSPATRPAASGLSI